MLKLCNSLGRIKENFKPLRGKRVGIYVCGPTVYGPDHLGHARTWLFFDWLRRFLLSEGYQVKFAQNITDVGHLEGDAEEGEDKIEKEAKEKGKTPEEIARMYEKEHFKDLEALNIIKPDFSPRATDHIGEIIDYIKVLIKKGHAYEVGGNVYFDVSSFPSYGRLSGRRVEEMVAGSRVKIDPRKKNPADFALWLAAGKHLQKWPSPWGAGYPGWHIECSVLSTKYLGQPFDIHGSANEHIFPHHENEIAQSWGYAGKPLAKYWLHSGMLLINGQKMAKSLKNFITIKDALKENDPDTIKLAFLATHWRKPFDWEESAIQEAKKVKEKLARAKVDAQPIKTGIPAEIDKALNDDFNTPKGLSVILENLSKLSRDDFDYLERLFGLKLTMKVELTSQQKKLIKARDVAREKGDYKKSDEIRKILEDQGIILEDTQAGTRILTR